MANKNLFEELREAEAKELASAASNNKKNVKVTKYNTNGGFSRKFDSKQLKGNKKISKANVNGKEMNGQNLKKRMGIKEKLLIGAATVAVGLGTIFGVKAVMNNNNTKSATETTGYRETVKDEINEDYLVRQASDIMIEYYKLNAGKSEMSAEEALAGVIAYNNNYIKGEQLFDWGYVGNVSPQEFTDNLGRFNGKMKITGRNTGMAITALEFKNATDKESYQAITDAMIDLGKGDATKLNAIVEKSIANGKFSDNEAINGLYVTALFDAVNSGVSNTSAECKGEATKYSTNQVTVANDYENKVNVELTIKGSASDPQDFQNLLNKVNEVYKNGKEGLTFTEEEKENANYTIGGSEKADKADKDFKNAVDNGAKVNDKNKTINLNPGKVADKTPSKNNGSNSTTDYRDNKDTDFSKGGQQVNPNDVKVGDKVTINGKTYIKDADGKYISVEDYNKVRSDAGKGVQKSEKFESAPQTNTNTNTNTNTSTSTNTTTPSTPSTTTPEQKPTGIQSETVFVPFEEGEEIEVSHGKTR